MSSTTAEEEQEKIRLSFEVKAKEPVAVDIGGSFAKLVYFRPVDPPELPSYVVKEGVDFASSLPVSADNALNVCTADGGVLRFLKFPSTRTLDFVQFLLNSELHKRYGLDIDRVNATGGGAYKYAKVAKDVLNIEFVQRDEMLSLIRGLNFLLATSPREVFTYSHVDERQRFISKTDWRYPYILVSVGSGVSILRVDGEESFERVSGSTIGGGTFWGLCKLITQIGSYEELKELSGRGDNRSVDLLVGDIYGADGYGQFGLPADLIASSFAKCGLADGDIDGGDNGSRQSFADRFRPEDVARSMLTMVANNIAQIAYLNAIRFDCKQIFFTGGFIHDNPAAWARISFGLDFWSQSAMSACFLRHDGYLGALGCMLSGGTPPNHTKASSSSNSSDFSSPLDG
jgi:pantothenate kinase